MKTRQASETVMTGRIERKRAHDREAQRASRAKTKAYISHLEKTVADLTESSGDARAHYLAQHATKQSQEIDNLQGLVQKIRTLIQDQVGEDGAPIAVKPEPTAAEQQNHHHHHRRGYPSPGSTSDNEHIHHPSTTDRQESSSPSSCADATRVDDAPHDSNPTAQDVDRDVFPAPVTGTTRNLVVLGESLLCTETDDRTFFQRLNRALEKLEAIPDHLSTQAEDEDILVRAIIHGWDAAERVHHFDIVWRFIRAFDEGFWHRAGAIERFAHHWLMRSLLLHKMCPKNQPRRATPAFMNPTLQQLVVVPHQPLADYYAWPKVRDLVIERGGLDITGTTSIAFVEAIRFAWPYALRDAYHIHKPSGMYQLSALFLTRFHDLTNYRLDCPPGSPHAALHPALTCADAMSSSTAGPDALLEYHARRSQGPLFSTETQEEEQLGATTPDFADLLAAAKKDLSSASTAMTLPPFDIAEKVAIDGWMPSHSIDASTEAAFLEYAMDQWPVL